MCLGPNNTSRRRQPGHCRVDEAGLDALDIAVLAVVRLVCQSFAQPDSQAWTRCLAIAVEAFPAERSTETLVAVLDLVQAMRRYRTEGFRFSNPDCANCSMFLSENEQQLLGAVVAARRGQDSTLHAHAMVLCEGHSAGELLECARALGLLLDGVSNTHEMVH
ncbi:hypothetical protein NNA36_19300 [Shimia sp. CNT1-13L.2]|uniref:hypothetical protein n=1 Tax=Shimia sp. CNT1-13L.2 TaxID=2959663 RepID=UPI0020CE9AEF|nr:hypothetical protein [Shimia sp. CNT1-13L.2]MCP9484114.1 hypothetical protein [Shimia sp. CNT1-13L.2]